MRRLATNLIANLAGQAWIAVVQIVTVPIYLRLLGPENYGLVGLYATLQGALLVLDLGVSPMLSREVARENAHEHTRGGLRSLVLTWASVYLASAAVLTLLLLGGAGWIVHVWLHSGAIPQDTLVSYARQMVVLACLQFPVSLGTGILTGLERQVEANLLRAAAATTTAAGAITLLKVVSPSLTLFLSWNIAVACVQAAALLLVVVRRLPAGRWTLARAVLARSWVFAAGMAGQAAASLLLSQADRLVLAALLPLDQFAYYFVAYSGARGLYTVVTPVFGPLFARLSSLVAAGDEDAVALLYERATQLLAVMTLPAAVTAAAFAPELLRVWTRDERAVAAASSAFALLVLGNAINGVMHAPYALQLAYGWTRIGLVVALVLLVLIVPAVVVAARHYGPTGTAAVWLALNVGYMLVAVPLTHRRLLRGMAGRWLWRDAGLPALAATAVVVVGRLAVPAGLHGAAACAVAIGGVGALAALGVSRDLRPLALAALRRQRAA